MEPPLEGRSSQAASTVQHEAQKTKKKFKIGNELPLGREAGTNRRFTAASKLRDGYKTFNRIPVFLGQVKFVRLVRR